MYHRKDFSLRQGCTQIVSALKAISVPLCLFFRPLPKLVYEVVVLTTGFSLFTLPLMDDIFSNNVIIHGIYIGLFATLIMDLFNVLGKKMKFHGGGSYVVIGRWFGGFYRGRFTHKNILTETPFPYEKYVGLFCHYCIGVLLAWIYLMSVDLMGVQAHQLGWSVTYGTITNILPWFIMFPACGFGMLALKGPAPVSMLRSSFCNHLGYGIALGVGMQLLALI